MPTIWNGLGVHARLLETSLWPWRAPVFLLAAKMRCDVISMLDTKYPVLSPYPTIHFNLLAARPDPPIIPVYNNEMTSLPKPTIPQPSRYPHSRTGIPRSRRWWWCRSHWYLTLFSVIQLSTRPRSEYGCGAGEGEYRLVRRWVGKDRREEGM
jgi:hypothetical protein